MVINFRDGDQEYPEKDFSLIEAFLSIAWNKKWDSLPDWQWVIPFFTTFSALSTFLDAFIGPIIRGGSGSGKGYWDDVLNKLSAKRDEIENNLEQDIEKTKQEVKEEIGEKGLRVFLKTKGKEYEPNSFKPKEGEYPAEGMDTEGNLYYFENNKWSIVE